MVRKIIFYVATLTILLTATCGAVSAATFSPYEGNISTSQLTYFEDLLPKLNINDHYVFFRSGQYTYDLIVGDITYDNGVFTSSDSCAVYTLETNNSYNGYYSYSATSIDSLTLNARDFLVYSDLGHYPELETRGDKYEMLQTLLFIVLMLGFVLRSIFCNRAR